MGAGTRYALPNIAYTAISAQTAIPPEQGGCSPAYALPFPFPFPLPGPSLLRSQICRYVSPR